jgi:hypothetical protein
VKNQLGVKENEEQALDYVFRLSPNVGLGEFGLSVYGS